MPRILIIDDDPFSRMELKRILEEDGHAVILADSADQGLALVERSSFDLVVVDIFMPGKDGLETICELRTMRPGVRILATTDGGSYRTIPEMDYLEIARALGATGGFPKPFSPGEVRMRVAATAAVAA